MTEGLGKKSKKEVLKEIIKGIHSGMSLEQAKDKFLSEAGSVTSLEIASLEQSLIDEGMDPAELVKLLNLYFSRMVDVVFRHDGTLDKFVGDALIVVFNDPFEQTDAEKRAVACAAEMQTEIAAFNREQAAAGKRTLGVGVGVHCGPVVAGNVGSEFRMDYTVIGDTVNFASRLQGKAPAGAVYVSGAVKDKTAGAFSYKSAGKMEFKGYKDPAEVFELQ